jgi:hypothetical protein
VTRLRAGQPRVQIKAVAKIHFSPEISRQALGPNRRQIQRVHGLFPVGKAAGASSWRLSSIYCQSEEWVECISIPPIRLDGVDIKNITFPYLHELANYQDRHGATKHQTYYTGYLGAEGRAIVKWILEKKVRVQAEFSWIRTWQTQSFCKHYDGHSDTIG